MVKNGTAPSEEEPIYKVWWNDRSKLEKKLIVASIVSAISLLLILIIYLLIPNEPKVCTSSTCVRTSMELLNYMDVKAEPCEDFYRFACGNFLQNTHLDNRGTRSVKSIMEDEIQSQIKNMLEQPEHSEDPIAFNLAKKFYRACMNESAIEAEGLKRMKQIFKQMGGWPTLNGNNWRESQFDWKDAVYKLRQIGINFEFFLILSVQRDKTDPDRYVLNLKDPSYRPSQISDNIKSLYLDYMVDVAVLMGATRERARNEQNDVMRFLLELAKISEEASNGTNLNPVSLSELQFEYSSVQWMEYINNILSPASQISHDDVIYISQPVYLKKLLKLLETKNKRVVANFICWHTLQHVINYLPKKILERAYDYLGKIHGKVIKKPRWNMCVNTTQSKFKTVVTASYVKKYFDDNTRSHVISMIRNIKHEFRQRVYQIDWLDEKSKDMAVEKLVSSVEEIATFNNLIEEYNTVYDKVEIVPDDLLTSVLNLDYANTNIQYGKLRQQVRDDFFINPGTVTGLNLVYSPEENALRIPVGIFQGIFYQTDRPEYMNYGALGTIIAHEIYHIIVEAKHKGLQGELRSLWSSHSLLNYEEKRKCLSKRHGKFITSKTEQHHLNTSNVQDEDMADLAGMKVSYDTYINWVQENGYEARLPGLNYTPNQLFWISSAIRHCSKYTNETLQRYIANYRQSPGQLRVNGALQNLAEFALDFGCPLGAKMNPEHKCRIW